MVKGAVRIETRMTQGDEAGVYRITEQKQRYLMLAFDEADEARTAAKAIAKLLKVRFKDHIYTEPKLGEALGQVSEEVKPKLFTRPKKVMGAPKLCLEMLTEGKLTEQEIKTIFTDKYTAAGHKSIKAWQLADWLLKAAKKNRLDGV